MGGVRKAPDPAATRAALLNPDANLAEAVRLSARTLAHLAPGHAVELRIPPFVAVQCIDGPRHTRGTPPNVVELPPQVWLQLARGERTLEEVAGLAGVEISGTRAGEIAHYLPLL
ncbi:hypothetical protein C1Y63_07050 [Corynebacterium sp. 13CS0277]|uniref:sterol carrier family protein n=1 Tax=Corynebacterium sp. 13CS0277 TaxID=2071994 RepID=UPI000D02C942|nr:sterol carrier family protein [Corynebacterium sp. 13CS0277]PRQ11302.1 hypothetical protein C1Y63_07050 [Corynebacterium sp. 13CS0277]